MCIRDRYCTVAVEHALSESINYQVTPCIVKTTSLHEHDKISTRCVSHILCHVSTTSGVYIYFSPARLRVEFIYSTKTNLLYRTLECKTVCNEMMVPLAAVRTFLTILRCVRETIASKALCTQNDEDECTDRLCQKIVHAECATY